MINLTEYWPIQRDSSMKLPQLEAAYLKEIKKYRSPHKILNAFAKEESVTVCGKEWEYPGFNMQELNFIKALSDSFDDIIIANPSELEGFISDFNNASLLGDMVKRPIGQGTVFRLNEFGKNISEYFNYTGFRNGSKSRWLADKLNIKSCPYCNSQYTLTVNNPGGGQLKFQFDHFYPKSKYPYLSISLYNLIPSCASCNLSKSDIDASLDTHYHPYASNLAEKFEFKIDYPIDLDALTTGNLENLFVETRLTANKGQKAFVKRHDELYNISGIYKRFETEAKRILKQAIIYREAGESMLAIKDLFGSAAEFENYLINRKIRKEDILEEPLTKFYQDIGRQLGLIRK